MQRKITGRQIALIEARALFNSAASIEAHVKKVSGGRTSDYNCLTRHEAFTMLRQLTVLVPDHVRKVTGNNSGILLCDITTASKKIY